MNAPTNREPRPRPEHPEPLHRDHHGRHPQHSGHHRAEPPLAAIWAQDRRGVIGLDGVLPWRIRSEYAHFRATTEGSTVVMGRRTWDSLPARFRPLPDRRNVVVSRDAAYDAPGAEVVTSAVAAACLPSATGTTWVIGGTLVFAALLPAIDVFVITDVDLDIAAENGLTPDDPRLTYAPRLGPAARELGDDEVTALSPRVAALQQWQGGDGEPRWRVRVLGHRG